MDVVLVQPMGRIEFLRKLLRSMPRRGLDSQHLALFTRRLGDLLDAGLLALRLGTLAGTRRAYVRTDAPYWLSPLADPLAAAAIARGIVRRGRQTWRGRDYS